MIMCMADQCIVREDSRDISFETSAQTPYTYHTSLVEVINPRQTIALVLYQPVTFPAIVLVVDNRGSPLYEYVPILAPGLIMAANTEFGKNEDKERSTKS